MQELREAGRGIPALPMRQVRKYGHITVKDGVLQAPNTALVARLTGVASSAEVRRYLLAAAADIGYETGGLRTAMSPWPDTGRPWRPGLGPFELSAETTQMRTACWIVIAYTSGMRDAEVRELAPDCAFTTLCTEAGISRATYYRSPLARIVTALFKAPTPPRPRTDILAAEITRLKSAERELRSRHAAEREELRATIATYAQHIQVLTLRLTELEAANATLRGQLDPTITTLPAPR